MNEYRVNNTYFMEERTIVKKVLVTKVGVWGVIMYQGRFFNYFWQTFTTYNFKD